ncbi:MAG: hypothetical protein K6F15_06785 [Treponema sp.]|nr:hypothetical protein [Treponema sp.]
MKKIVFCLLLVTIASNIYAKRVKPLYQIPEKLTLKEEEDLAGETKNFLVASSKGLFKISPANSAMPLWTEGSVEQILRTEMLGEDGKIIENWYFRTSKGILFSSDLENFELRNEGLPVLTLKRYDGQNITFEKQVAELKDIGSNPLNPLQLVTATKDAVYLSRDGGKNWRSLGSMSGATPGVKACAIGSMPLTYDDGTKGTELVVFMSHPIFGLSYIKPDANRPSWFDVAKGFEMLPSMTSPDEIADIYPVISQDEEGNNFVEMYITNTFIPRIYKFDWPNRCGQQIYKGSEPAETFDGIFSSNGKLYFSVNEGIRSFDLKTNEISTNLSEKTEWEKSFACVPGDIAAAWIPYSMSGTKKGLCLNELWLLYPGSVNSPYGETAKARKAIYVSAYQCRLQSGIDKFKKLIKDNNLNSLVIDMKDDYGLLRYDAKDPLVVQKGKITQYAVDLEHFVSEFKKDNVYLVARIVVFKDRNLSKYGNSKYSVWNYNTQSPWLGIKEYEDIIDEESGEVTGKNTIYYDENWVDPYCPEVWEYNVAIAKELISRGFDEIQFDYIRFPTDGYNLRQASYRWKSEGMDKESALVSFLSYARENIKAPIGIDIYGANGWYRSGTRTGQDVEMMAHYVDVIGPMFYPSHFENSFMNYPPAADRTYRIYYYGTYRNTILARNKVVVRPWVQTFYLNVSYDRQYYDKNYVTKEIFGVRDSVNNGYMHWNNAGNYDMLCPDVKEEDPFIGTCEEASTDFRKPAFGTSLAPEFRDGGISLLNNVYQHGENGPDNGYDSADMVYTPLMQVKLMNRN